MVAHSVYKSDFERVTEIWTTGTRKFTYTADTVGGRPRDVIYTRVLAGWRKFAYAWYTRCGGAALPQGMYARCITRANNNTEGVQKTKTNNNNNNKILKKVYTQYIGYRAPLYVEAMFVYKVGKLQTFRRRAGKSGKINGIETAHLYVAEVPDVL